MKETSIYFKRRKKLARLMQNNSIVILESATEKIRTMILCLDIANAVISII